VAAGETHSCGLKTDGTAVCWGSDHSGESTAPAGTFVQLAAGTDQTCGVQSDGTVTCWGYGYGAAATMYEAFTPPSGTFLQVSLSRKVGEDQHACALRSDGELVCWQECSEGQCNPPSGPFKQVGAGQGFTCGLRTGGTISCWGRNDDGQASPPAGTFKQIGVGERVTVTVQMRGDAAPVEALAEVRWCRPFVELDDRPAGVGLRFIDTPLRAALLAGELRLLHRPDAS